MLMIKENQILYKNWMICVIIKHFITKMQSQNYSLLDLESSLNSNKTFSFISHVVVLNFSSKL